VARQGLTDITKSTKYFSSSTGSSLSLTPPESSHIIPQKLDDLFSQVELERYLGEALQRGDTGNFTGALSVPHFELGGKTIGLVGEAR
jgi:hypothetical protein